MGRFMLLTLLALATSLPQIHAQCPNDLGSRPYNFNYRTMSSNTTWFLVPVPIPAVQQAIREPFFPLANLLQPTLLPLPAWLDFPPNTHPVLVNSAFCNDIRQENLKIDGPLLTANNMVPFVGINGRSTPLSVPLATHIAGVNSNFLAGGIPALVATLFGINTRVGAFLPNNAAYRAVGDGTYSANTKKVVLPNPITGPGIYPEATGFRFSSVAPGKYSLEQWKSVINLPYVLNSVLFGRCQRNTYFFNDSAADVEFRAGRVDLGPAAGFNTLTGVMVGSYGGGQPVQGISACAQLFGFDRLVAQGEDCEVAAGKVEN